MAPLVLRKQNTLQMLHRFHETGDEALIEAVIRSQQQRVYALCLRELRHEADAHDAAQTVLMRLVQHAGRIETDLDAWLARTCKNTCISLIRSSAARRKREATTARDNREMMPINPDELSEAEARAILERCLAHLDEADAKLLHHRFIHGTSQSDLAEMFGISQQAVSKRIRRVLTNLRGEMSQRGVFGLLGGTLVIAAFKHALLQSKQAMAAVLPGAASSATRSLVGTAGVSTGVTTGIKVAAGVAVASAAGVGLKIATPTEPVDNTPIDKAYALAELAQPLTKPIKHTLLNGTTDRTAQPHVYPPTQAPINQLTGHAAPSQIPVIGRGSDSRYANNMTLVLGGQTVQVPRPSTQSKAASAWPHAQSDTHVGWRSAPVPAQIAGTAPSFAPPAPLLSTTDLGASTLAASPDTSDDEPKTLIESAKEAVFKVLEPGIPDLFPDVSLPSIKDLSGSIIYYIGSTSGDVIKLDSSSVILNTTSYSLTSASLETSAPVSATYFRSARGPSAPIGLAPPPSTQAPALVPEPVTGVVLGTLVLGGLLRRRHRG